MHKPDITQGSRSARLGTGNWTVPTVLPCLRMSIRLALGRIVHPWLRLPRGQQQFPPKSRGLQLWLPTVSWLDGFSFLVTLPSHIAEDEQKHLSNGVHWGCDTQCVYTRRAEREPPFPGVEIFK